MSMGRRGFLSNCSYFDKFKRVHFNFLLYESKLTTEKKLAMLYISSDYYTYKYSRRCFVNRGFFVIHTLFIKTV